MKRGWSKGGLWATGTLLVIIIVAAVCLTDFRSPEQLSKDFFGFGIPREATNILVTRRSIGLQISYNLPATKIFELTHTAIPGYSDWEKENGWTQLIDRYLTGSQDLRICEAADYVHAERREIIVDMKLRRVYVLCFETG